MGRIHLLEDSLINKIAAGEVVERPASVVKELVENALDAGARHISVELVDGGKRRITVTDDGCGLAQDDALLALKRHATSKINAADDLFNIATMGFRGEALPSIAAVSRLTLCSRARGAAMGCKVFVAGDEGEPGVLPWSGAEGTSLTAADLFFNIPVRAKFLKNGAAEFAHCLELMQALALSHPNIGFTLLHNDKESLRVSAQELDGDGPWIGEKALRARTAQVLGEKTEKGLLYLAKANRHGAIEALISAPGLEKPNAKAMFTFVNGRLVKDKVLRYGLLRGYASHLLRGKYPVIVANITVDPSLVDVNVHPAKTELRFQYQNEVQGLLALAVRESLRAGHWATGDQAEPLAPASVPQGLGFTPALASARSEVTLSSGATSPAASLFHDAGGALSLASPSRRADDTAARGAVGPASPYSGEVKRSRLSFDGVPSPSWRSTPPALPFVEPGLDGGSASLGGQEAISWSELTYLGAFARCYLFFARADQLLVVDQHAFHERILYERLLADRALLLRRQPLLVPEAVEMAPTEASTLAARRGELASMGFDIDVCGTTTVELRAVPSLLAGRDTAQLLCELARVATSTDTTAASVALGQNILATIACHAAVRAGEELGDNELKQLLAEAARVDFYLNCPHGRRVFRWWKASQVASWFDR